MRLGVAASTEGEAPRELWGMLPQEMFISKCSEMPISTVLSRNFTCSRQYHTL